MPFLRAGCNWRHKPTGILGWTREIDGKRFEPAELIRFIPSGDLAWLHAAESPRFVAWGDNVVLGCRPEFDLPGEWQFGLPQSTLPVSGGRAPPTKPVKIMLPYPVSANRYWMSFWATNLKRVITGVTKEAEAFKEECGWLAKAAGVRVPFEGLVELRMRLIPENRVCMDLDNALKVSIDALKGIVYKDDSQIYRIVAERGDADPTGKRLEVEVLPYVMPTALERALELEAEVAA